MLLQGMRPEEVESLERTDTDFDNKHDSDTPGEEQGRKADPELDRREPPDSWPAPEGGFKMVVPLSPQARGAHLETEQYPQRRLPEGGA